MELTAESPQAIACSRQGGLRTGSGVINRLIVEWPQKNSWDRLLHLWTNCLPLGDRPQTAFEEIRIGRLRRIFARAWPFPISRLLANHVSKGVDPAKFRIARDSPGTSAEGPTFW